MDKYQGYTAHYNLNTSAIAIASPEGTIVKIISQNDYAGELGHLGSDKLIDSLLEDSGYTLEELGIIFTPEVVYKPHRKTVDKDNIRALVGKYKTNLANSENLSKFIGYEEVLQGIIKDLEKLI